MKIIDILSHDQQLAAPLGIEPRECDVRGIGLDLAQSRSPRVIEKVHQRGIADECLGGRDILDAMPLP